MVSELTPEFFLRLLSKEGLLSNTDFKHASDVANLFRLPLFVCFDEVKTYELRVFDKPKSY